MYVSYCHSSLLEFVSRFGRQNRNPLSSLRTLLAARPTDVIESTDVKSTDVESTDVVELTNAVESTDVGDSSGETC